MTTTETDTKTNGTVLQLENVHTYYGAIHAIKGVTMEVRDGAFVGVQWGTPNDFPIPSYDSH
jgi:ABC-type uncharacterized transport system ATPase subunit